MRCRFTFVELMNTTLDFAIEYEKEYGESFVAARAVNILKDVRVFEFLTGMSAQSHYQYKRAAKMMLKHEGVLDLLKSLSDDDG